MPSLCFGRRPCTLPAFVFACWLAASPQGALGVALSASNERFEHQPAAVDGASGASIEHQPDTGMWDHVIVVPEHRLLFCAVNGVKAEEFNQLFRRIRTQWDPSQKTGPKWFRNAYWVHGYSEESLRALYREETWHKAVFVRDPIERFVVTFNTTCGSLDEVGKASCRAMFGNSAPRTLPEAVNRFRSGMSFDINSVTHKDNAFLTRQGNFCGGLHRFKGKYNTLTQLRPRTMHDDVENMLTKVGIPQSFYRHSLKEFFPVNAEPELAQRLSKFFPPEHAQWMLQTLLTQYSRDYQELDLPVPRWIEFALTKDGGQGLPVWAQRLKKRAQQMEKSAAAASENNTDVFGDRDSANESVVDEGVGDDVGEEMTTGEVTTIQN